MSCSAVVLDDNVCFKKERVLASSELTDHSGNSEVSRQAKAPIFAPPRLLSPKAFFGYRSKSHYNLDTRMNPTNDEADIELASLSEKSSSVDANIVEDPEQSVPDLDAGRDKEERSSSIHNRRAEPW